jgi:hypothetical protein
MFHARTATKVRRATGATLVARGRTLPTVSTPSVASVVPVASVAPVALVAPAGPAAPAANSARAALAIAAVLAVGLLTFSVGTAGGAPRGKNKASHLTLAGTTVTLDGRTPVRRVRITVMPESTVTFTDIDGDFLVSWNGCDGWITVIPEERARDGGEWCKRVVLRGQPPEAQDPIVDLDLGLITVALQAQVGYYQAPIPSPTYPRPASLRVPGPKPGEPDTCRVQVSYATDLWGHITRVEVSGGDQPPSGLKDALFSWIRSVPWTVAAETPCDSPEPFKTREWMDYAWADTAWVQIPGARHKSRPRPPGSVPQGR